MNAQIARAPIVREQYDALLRYPDPSARRAHHVEQREHRQDRERAALILAERALRRLDIVVDSLDEALSITGIELIFNCLYTIRESQTLARAALGMAPIPQIPARIRA